VKLPEDVIIPEDKLVRYLLLPRQESDKSQFLGRAGYTLASIKWEVQGILVGPNGQVLRVVTVWITLEASGETRFVTLFPDRERQR
jgi:hypothetical protein